MARSGSLDPRGLRLLLVRHAATAWNTAQRYGGRSDQPLDQHGLAQADQLATWLASETPTVAIHSGSLRAIQTLGRALAGQPVAVQIDGRWRDHDYGTWEGLTYRDLQANWADQAAKYWRDPWNNAPPEGETLAAVADRVAAATTELISSHAGATVLLLADATPLQLLLSATLGTPPELHWRWKLDLGSLSCIQLYGAGPIVNWLNRGYTPPPAC